MKQTIILLSIFLLLLGCGKSTEEIRKAEKIAIVHELGLTGCLFLKEKGNHKIQTDKRLKDKIKNISYNSKSNNVSCQTYNKKKNTLTSYADVIQVDRTIACAELHLSDAQEAYPNKDFSLLKNSKKSCVVAFDIQ